MNVLPVLDLLEGRAVQAVGGLRHDYQPLRSVGCSTACPFEITRCVRERFGFSQWYLADLDGIVHRRWNLDLVSQLIDEGLKLCVDWGIRDVEDLFRIGRFSESSQCIIASEVLLHRSAFDALSGMADPSRLIFSLDLLEGELNAPPGAWEGAKPVEVIDYVYGRGVKEVIVLDLAYVGCQRGLGTLGICQELKQAFPELGVITGGGVRTTAHLKQIRQAGVNGVLLGSCLHQGSLSPEELIQYFQQDCLPESHAPEAHAFETRSKING